MFASPRTRVITILMAIALVTGVVACGGDDDDNAESATETATESSTDSGGGASTATVTTAVPETAVPPSTASQSTAPVTTAPPLPPSTECDNLTPLVTNEFNDVCDPGPGGWESVLSTQPGTWHTVACPDMIAVPNQMIIAIDPAVPGATPGLNLDDEIVDVNNALGGVATATALESNESAALLELTMEQDKTVEDVLRQLPNLQAVGRSVDLNYLEPLQPNDGFRPADDPHSPRDGESPPDSFGGGGDRSVLVIDSPLESDTTYDTEPNGYVDESQGHGLFVKSIIERSGAAIRFVGVQPLYTTMLSTGRWSPMTFSDWDIVLAILGSLSFDPDIVNLSLGGVGCEIDQMNSPAIGDPFEFGIGERLALAQIMRLAWGSNEDLRIVAAAGNNSSNSVLHFPAAWRNSTAMADIADQIALNDSATAQDVRDMSSYLRGAMFAVGSFDKESETRSDFSNYGCWVNAAAYGRDQFGEYPTATYGEDPASTTTTLAGGSLGTYAQWSGTSFATANFTAALAARAVSASTIHPPTGARILDYGLGVDKAGVEADCPQNIPITTAP